MGQSRDDPLITFLQIPCHVIVHVLAHELWRQLRGILHVNFRTNDLENNFLTIDNLTMIYLPPHNPFNSSPPLFPAPIEKGVITRGLIMLF